MYDEERDRQARHWSFWTRVVVLGFFAVATCAALLPSVVGFFAGDNEDTRGRPLTLGL